MFPQIFGKYVLEREIASGGMAVVYLATLRGAGGFEKRLVVKQIRAELASDTTFVERFVTEAKTTVGLSHPNIVPVYELGVEQGVYFIAMELAQGVTLSELLQTGGRLTAQEGAYLGVEISRALDYAHRKAGIVHRDVTPRNVLIDDEGAVRLIDFGIAAPVSGDGAYRERVYGSPGHMPLEQLRGGRLTPATDVFAVGALLIEAWTAEPPFRRSTKTDSDAALLVPPPRVSATEPALAALDDLVARAVAPDPAVRPQTMDELARPLREFLRAADLGDLARRLGDRVRRARRASQESVRPPPAVMAQLALPGAGAIPGPMTPVTPPMPATRPMAHSVTETFAARDEVVEWTRPRSEHPSFLDEPLAEIPLPPPAPLPKVPGPDRGPSRGMLAVVGVAVSAALGAFVASRSPPPAAVSAPSTSAPRAPLPPPSSADDTVLPSPSAPSPSATKVAVTVPTPGSAASTPGAPSSSAFVSEEAATLSVTADLPARVSLDGASLGVTPLRAVHKASGHHVLVVTSTELDERLSAPIELAKGRTTIVHAEFTRAVPALRVR